MHLFFAFYGFIGIFVRDSDRPLRTLRAAIFLFGNMPVMVLLRFSAFYVPVYISMRVCVHMLISAFWSRDAQSGREIAHKKHTLLHIYMYNTYIHTNTL